MGGKRESLSRLSLPRQQSFSLPSSTPSGDMARAVWSEFPPPYLVKSPIQIHSVGLSNYQKEAPNLHALPDALADMLDAHTEALVEELITGQSVSVGIIDDYRGETIYALPTTLVSSKKSSESPQFLVPAPLPHDLKKEIESLARALHSSYDLSGTSVTDFTIHPSGRIYLSHIHTLPSMKAQSVLTKSLHAVGGTLKDLFTHLIHRSHKGK
jgi:D-alanine-D-alanine ligase-like ATP-grasp enzyme